MAKKGCLEREVIPKPQASFTLTAEKAWLKRARRWLRRKRARRVSHRKTTSNLRRRRTTISSKTSIEGIRGSQIWFIRYMASIRTHSTASRARQCGHSSWSTSRKCRRASRFWTRRMEWTSLNNLFILPSPCRRNPISRQRCLASSMRTPTPTLTQWLRGQWRHPLIREILKAWPPGKLQSKKKRNEKAPLNNYTNTQ